MKAAAAVALALLAAGIAPAQEAWRSSKVQYDASGRLFYPADASGNRIPDYSHAGYKGGGVPLPTVPVVLTLSPVAGDNTAHIQAAIDEVGDAAGAGRRLSRRGSAHRRRLRGRRHCPRSTRAAWCSAALATAPTRRLTQSCGAPGRRRPPSSSPAAAPTTISGPKCRERAGSITTPRVGVGLAQLHRRRCLALRVGDPVIILHPSTPAWIAAMDNGGVTDANTWRPGDIDIRYHRYITADLRQHDRHRRAGVQPPRALAVAELRLQVRPVVHPDGTSASRSCWSTSSPPDPNPRTTPRTRSPSSAPRTVGCATPPCSTSCTPECSSRTPRAAPSSARGRSSRIPSLPASAATTSRPITRSSSCSATASPASPATPSSPTAPAPTPASWCSTP